MKFYQYWIIVIAIILVFLTIFNITKMIMLLNKEKGDKLEQTKELNVNIRNLLISMALLSLTSLIYIILIFMQVR
jgi:NADH:ubiquinone oxidoreductase subunit 5 (subunit L)/multisubunit Na+/H+ antiporter MnhA subunit